MRRLPRLADESGAALVMALGITLTMSLVVAALLQFTSSNSRWAYRDSANERAHSIAEAGLNNAFAVLSEYYATKPLFPGDPCVLRPQPAGTCPAAPPFTSTFDGGVASWWGTLTYSSTGWSWVVRSTGRVPNPTGPNASDVTRTVTAKLPVVMPQARDVPPTILNWIYSARDTIITNTVALRSPILVNGNLQFDNQAAIDARVYVAGDLRFKGKGGVTRGPLFVGGRLFLDHNDAGIGSSDAPVPEVDLVGGCRWTKNGSLPLQNPCRGAPDNVHATTLGQTVRALPVELPQRDQSLWDFWYEHAAPGPKRACTTSSGTVPTWDTADGILSRSVVTVFNLTPTAAYSCKYVISGVTVGELSWNPTASPPTLTIAGTMFIDGNATIRTTGNTAVRYVGQGTLYLSGTMLVTNVKLCAVVDGANCATHAGAWDPNERLFLIVADGSGTGGGDVPPVGYSIEVKSAQFQGALWGTNHVAGTSGGTVHGPVISTNGRVELSQAGASTFPAIEIAPPGAPGTPPPPGELLEPIEFGG